MTRLERNSQTPYISSTLCHIPQDTFQSYPFLIASSDPGILDGFANCKQWFSAFDTEPFHRRLCSGTEGSRNVLCNKLNDTEFSFGKW